MRHLFLTEAELADLQRQEFMREVASRPRPNYADVSEATIKDMFCVEEDLDNYKIEYSPEGCSAVKFLWTQPDGNSCGACAVNNVTQLGIAKSLCKQWLSQEHIKKLLEEKGFRMKQYTSDQLKFMHEKGNLSTIIGLVVNQGGRHWVALRKCEAGWLLLDSLIIDSRKETHYFRSLYEAIEALTPQWPVFVISTVLLPRINQKELQAFLSHHRS